METSREWKDEIIGKLSVVIPNAMVDGYKEDLSRRDFQKLILDLIKRIENLR